jgi:SWI/SNF-related matrix-associated actin-dependent regulator 1 of chromatin subfamily A
MKLRDYQTFGIRWMRFQSRAARMSPNAAPRFGSAPSATTPLLPVFLADDPGLGKSVQFVKFAIDTIAEFEDVPPYILLMVPSIGRVSWAIEAPKWLPEDWKVASVKADGPTSFEPNTLYVCTYDLAAVNHDVQHRLYTQSWGVVGLDEAHYLKSTEAKRTRFVYGPKCDGGMDSLVGRAKMVACLSGTPSPNNAGELWTHLNALRPGLLRENGITSKTQFEDTFCNVRVGAYGRQITGSKNQEQLRKICKTFILRRRKQDVLADLPAVQVQDTPLDLTDKERKQALDLATQFSGKMFADTGGSAPESDEALVEMLSKHGANLAAVRRALGIMKAPASASWITARIENGVKKLIVFAYHRDVLDILQDNTEFKSVRIDGSTPPEERAAAVKQFQEDKDTKIFFGQIVAAGTAITLTAASEVVLVEADWVPGVNEQAIARAHRMGQSNAVLATFLFMPGTVDHRIMSAFRRKAQQTLAIYEPTQAAAPTRTPTSQWYNIPPPPTPPLVSTGRSSGLVKSILDDAAPEIFAGLGNVEARAVAMAIQRDQDRARRRQEREAEIARQRGKAFYEVFNPTS